MMTKSVVLTQPNSKQQWVVVVGKREFLLTDSQVDILKKADLAGQRGIVWFESFAISIPHIDVIYSEERKTDSKHRQFEEIEDDKGNIRYVEISSGVNPSTITK